MFSHLPGRKCECHPKENSCSVVDTEWAVIEKEKPVLRTVPKVVLPVAKAQEIRTVSNVTEKRQPVVPANSTITTKVPKEETIISEGVQKKCQQDLVKAKDMDFPFDYNACSLQNQEKEKLIELSSKVMETLASLEAHLREKVEEELEELSCIWKNRKEESTQIKDDLIQNLGDRIKRQDEILASKERVIKTLNMLLDERNKAISELLENFVL